MENLEDVSVYVLMDIMVITVSLNQCARLELTRVDAI